MKNLIKSCFLLILTLGVAAGADAQRTSKKRLQQGTTTTPEQQTQEQVNNNKAPVSYNSNIKIEVDSSGAADTMIRKSLRNDNAYDKGGLSERTPLPYEHLRWDDALYSEKVWRELDLREKMNQPFRYDANDDNGSQIFVNMLIKAVKAGEITAFSNIDDRFTTPITVAEIETATQGTADTTEVRNIADPNKIDKYVVTRASFDPKSVVKIRIKEEWVFDREASRMFVRILGIAPVITQFNPNGTERGSKLLFWIYYPDLRPILAKYEVYNPKNMGASRMTWEELFESRMFSSYITKSTLDNPNNRNVRQMIKDPILALLEGDNIKERIFNYEQDLWSY